MNQPCQLPDDFRVAAVNALKELRQDLSEFAEEQSLIFVEVSVGLLLYDVVNLIGLSPDERRAVLGTELDCQVETFLSTPI